jgi:hypothetical protein
VPTITCPYCFARQQPAELLYRCKDECRGGSDRSGTFPPIDLRPDGRCPHGRRPQARRCCVDCKDPLPRDYVEHGHHLIALVGAPQAGKSTFVGVLVHELRGVVGERLGDVSVEPLGDASRRYLDRLEGPLYGQGLTPAPTPPGRSREENRYDPLIIALRWQPRRRHQLGRRRVSTAMLVFYDTAGEDVSSDDHVDFLTEYLSAASGVLFMLDAEAFVDPARNGEGRQALEVLVQQLREVGRTDVPIAAVFSKIDVLASDDAHFGPTSPLRRTSRHDLAFDDVDSTAVHEDLCGWLVAQDLGDTSRTLRATVSDLRFFGVSALGHSPIGGRRIAAGGIQPLRVEDPVLWLLSRFGSGPANGRRP